MGRCTWCKNEASLTYCEDCARALGEEALPQEGVRVTLETKRKGRFLPHARLVARTPWPMPNGKPARVWAEFQPGAPIETQVLAVALEAAGLAKQRLIQHVIRLGPRDWAVI